MSFLFITNIFKLITVTKPAAALMWINVYSMYTTGEVATLIADIPTDPSNEPLFCTSSLIIHGVFFFALSAASPFVPLIPAVLCSVYIYLP